MRSSSACRRPISVTVSDAFARDLEQRAIAAEHPQRHAVDVGGGAAPRARRTPAGAGCSARARSRATSSSPSIARAVASTSSCACGVTTSSPPVTSITPRMRRDLGIVHGNGGARPRLHEPVEVLGAADLHRAIERERRAGGRGADGGLRPVRALDEAHVAGERADVPVALDPQQAAGGVADGDHDARLARLARQQQRADHVHHARERVRAAVLLELGAREIERRKRLGTDEAGQRAAPRLLHERPHVAHALLGVVSGDELFVRALDQQAGGLR